MKIIRFLVVYILIQAILLTPARASPVGGWSMSNPVAQGASTVYNGAKNVIIDGKNYIKSGTAKITPTAAQVGKVLARGGAAYALSVAVQELLGAVDWVLDPANNQITYTEKQDPNAIPPNLQYYWHNGNDGKRYSSPESAAAAYIAKQCLSNSDLCSAKKISSEIFGNLPFQTVRVWFEYDYFQVKRQTFVDTGAALNPNYDPNAVPEDKPKSIPLTTVAARVISNAESADDTKARPAQVATTAAAADMVAEAETDQTGVKARPIVQQLEKSAETKAEDEAAQAEANKAEGTQTQNPTKPNVTDLSLEFPAFCGWAPVVCEAAQTVISFPTTLSEWWETGKSKAESWAQSISEAWEKTKEWAKEGEKEPTELDIPEPPQQEMDTDIAFSGQCPDDKKIPFNIGAFSYDLNFSYSLICQPLSQAKPILILVGAFLSALIIGGIRQ